MWYTWRVSTLNVTNTSIDCIHKVQGYIEKENEAGALRQYAIDCPDCDGDAVYDPEKDIVFCYTCGGGWTNTQLRECRMCGEIKLREDTIPDGICGDCEWEMEDDDDDE